MNDNQYEIRNAIKGDHITAILQTNDSHEDNQVWIAGKIIADDSINPELLQDDERELEKSGYESITVRVDEPITLNEAERELIWIDTHTRITQGETVNAGWFEPKEQKGGITASERKQAGTISKIKIQNDNSENPEPPTPGETP